jgi:hypothetical protein
MDALVNHVKHECPNVAEGAPPSVSSQSQKIVQEMGGTLLVTLLHNDRHAIRRFELAVAHLHWSNNKLTELVKSEAGKLEKISSITVPSLCINIRAWAASHFEILPTRTEQFDPQLRAKESGLQQTNLRLVQRYEDSKTRVLARRTRALQKRFERREGNHALRAFFALIRAIFPGQCTPGRLCLPFQILTPGDLERGQISA